MGPKLQCILRPRRAAALILTPLAVALLFALALGIERGEVSGDVLGMVGLSALFGYPLLIAVGLPAFLWFEARDRLSALTALLTGLACGYLASVGMLAEHAYRTYRGDAEAPHVAEVVFRVLLPPFSVPPIWFILTLCSVLGILIFWLIGYSQFPRAIWMRVRRRSNAAPTR
ncbi:MAG: hypothetical protein AAGE18_03885 [Pseudomonadota bacterium]